MTQEEQRAYHNISALIKFGYQSIAEIRATGNWSQSLPSDWIDQLIQEEFQKHQKAALSWEQPTDPEKLLAVFNELRKLNIIALHKAGPNNSSGRSDAAWIHSKMLAEDILSAGYCFYHEQNLENALEQGELMIAFGMIDETTDAATKKLGELIYGHLAKAGFSLSWDGEAKTKIKITNISWQKAYSDDAAWKAYTIITNLKKNQ